MKQQVGNGEIVVELRMPVVVEHGLARRGVELGGDQPLSRRSGHGSTLGPIDEGRRLSGKRDGDQAGENDEERKEHFRNSSNQRSPPRRRHGVRGHGALHHKEIRAPIAERQHEAEPHRQAKPLHAESIRVRVAHANPRMHIRRTKCRFQPCPAAHVLQA